MHGLGVDHESVRWTNRQMERQTEWRLAISRSNMRNKLADRQEQEQLCNESSSFIQSRLVSKYLFRIYFNLVVIRPNSSKVKPCSNSTIATSIVHSKLDYCNSLYYNLPQSQMKKTPEHPELSCSCCHQNAKIFSHHSCSEISTLAENKRTH